MSGTVRIRYHKPTNSGRREGWAMFVDGIVKGEKGAKGFSGSYVPADEQIEVSPGTLILQVSPTGSVKNWGQEAEFFRVTAEGKLESVSASYDWRSEYLDCQDAAAELLAAEKAVDIATLKEELAELRERAEKLEIQIAMAEGRKEES